jgi:hypothetical protein
MSVYIGDDGFGHGRKLRRKLPSVAEVDHGREKLQPSGSGVPLIQPASGSGPVAGRQFIPLRSTKRLSIEVGHSDTDQSSVLHVPDLGLIVAGDVIYNGVHQYLGESADGGRDKWRKAIDIVAALRPRWIVADHKNKELDDDAVRVIAETRQYLDDADELLTKNSAPGGFFKAMLKRYPNRRPGATTLWAGTSSLYAQRDGRGAEASIAGWL